eukprot:Blabericola_migrator_1__5889@NODE_297_length_10209_cov_136_062907_g244_i0_p7_GENE_NODE_297_length_10209_cov_136_062907_g244_i0NODE_297_length_10209_cov_136_062907_g244_i0_p7_ORF_typecomplete_len154_score31_53Prefoldin/PF02996_17/1_2e12IMD/PF08397_11/0_026IMD/PF08397_11/5_7e03XhlA/PF10779_9/0_4XhlA/PF10779_9/3_3e03_NODE_297_length_10209_cov_136_062907_g244_i054825943
MSLFADDAEEDSSFAIDDKLKQYEKFMDDVLRKKLTDAESAEKAIRANLVDIQDSTRALKRLLLEERHDFNCLLDIGCETMAKVYVEDTSSVMVELTQGYYLEMPVVEAINHLQKRLVIWQEKHARSVERIARAKTEVQVFVSALAAVMDLAE